MAEGRELEAPVTGVYCPWLGVRGARVCEREAVPEVRFAEEPGGTRPERRPENVPCSPSQAARSLRRGTWAPDGGCHCGFGRLAFAAVPLTTSSRAASVAVAVAPPDPPQLARPIPPVFTNMLCFRWYVC